MDSCLELIKDLNFLHDKAGFSLEELDDEILHFVVRKIGPSLTEIKKKKMELYINYSTECLIKIETNINKLLKTFSDVKKYNEELSDLYEEFSNFESDYEEGNYDLDHSLLEIKKIFELINKLDNKLYDNGKLIAAKGRKKFLNPYFVLLGITSIVYGWLIKNLVNDYWYYVGVGWIGIAIVTFFILKLIARLFIFREVKLK